MFFDTVSDKSGVIKEFKTQEVKYKDRSILWMMWFLCQYLASYESADDS